jgi:phage tail tape-measure protein
MAEKDNEQLGSLTGIAAGAIAGASAGSVVLPVIGTFGGALIGGILGSEVGRTVGGAILNALNPEVAPVDVPKTDTQQPDMIAQLEKLGQLRTQGLITEEEFAAAKAKLLGL